MNKIVFSLIMMLCMSSCVYGSDEAATDYDSELLPAGTAAPDFRIPADGNPGGVTLSSFRGKYVVLEFWASWCPDCRKVTGKVRDMHSRFASDSVVFVGVSFDTNRDTWTKYVRDNGMDWLQLCELKPWKETTVSKAYGVKWIPAFYIISPDGKILAGSVSPEKIEARLEELHGRK